ncbi:MAG: integrase arm-type DNA-binding domain-containing protein [Rhodospirillales bacterium]
MPVVGITKRAVDAAKPGASEYSLWDSEVKGFGVRVRRSGVKVYVVQYRAGKGRGNPVKRYTIGKHGAPWTPDMAREEAKRVLGEVAAGHDPASDRQATRQAEKDAPTVRQMAERWLVEHVDAKRKPKTAYDYRRIVNNVIVPAVGRKKMASLTHADIDQLHYARRTTPYEANYAVRVLSALCNWAVRHGYRPDGSNPCRGLERFKETRRERFLSPRELRRLARALAAAERCGAVNPWQAAAIRLLIFSGARLGEVLAARWDWIDMEKGSLALPDSKTGAKVIHLNPPALEVLRTLPRLADNPYLICGRNPGAHVVNLEKPWRRVRQAALLPDVRIHDLRHSFASVAVAAGASLPLIGGLLGHSQPATTHRYAHLADDPLKAAADMVGTALAGMMAGTTGKTVKLRERRR